VRRLEEEFLAVLDQWEAAGCPNEGRLLDRAETRMQASGHHFPFSATSGMGAWNKPYCALF
jgi:hypothetical protein